MIDYPKATELVAKKLADLYESLDPWDSDDQLNADAEALTAAALSVIPSTTMLVPAEEHSDLQADSMLLGRIREAIERHPHELITKDQLSELEKSPNEDEE